MLKSFLYFSTMVTDQSPKDLDKMMFKFQERNKTISVTGAMVYCDRNVIQYFEGESDSVVRLMNSISQDPRHTISITVSENKKARVFPDWTMGYKVSGVNEFIQMKNLLGNTEIEKVIKNFIENN